MDISQTSQTRFWRCHGCRGYSSQWMDAIPNASWFMKAAIAHYQTWICLKFWEQFQYAASALFALVHGTDLTSLKGNSKCVLLCGELWGAWYILLYHIRDKQHIAWSYNQGKNLQFTHSAPKHLEAFRFNRETIPMKVQQLQCLVLRKAILAYCPPRLYH